MNNLPRVHVLEAELPEEFRVRDTLRRFVGYDETFDKVRIFCHRAPFRGQAFVSNFCPTNAEIQANIYAVVDG